MKKSVSVIVSAYNEQDNIKDAIKSVLKAVNSVKAEYEIIVVDDGSTDGTLAIVEDEVKKNTRIRFIHHSQNLGVGKCFSDGVLRAHKNYVTVFPGDNDMSSDSLIELFKLMDSAELIIAYPPNQKHRSLERRFLSLCFTKLMNLIFRQKLKYYNGPFIARTALIKKLKLRSQGFLIFAEFKLKLIHQGYPYKEIPFEHVGRKHGRSKAVSIYNLFDTLKTVINLRHDLN